MKEFDIYFQTSNLCACALWAYAYALTIFNLFDSQFCLSFVFFLLSISNVFDKWPFCNWKINRSMQIESGRIDLFFITYRKKAVYWFLVVSTILNVFDDISWIALYSIYDSTQNRTFLTIQMYSRIHVQGMLWVTLAQVQKPIIWMLSSHNFSINSIAPKWQCSQFDNKMFRFALFLRFIRSLIFHPVNEGKKNKQIYAINKCKYQIKSYEHGTEVMRYAKF